MRKKLPSFWEPVALLLVSLTFMVLILGSESMINIVDMERTVEVADIALAFLLCLVTCFFVLNLCKVILYQRLRTRERKNLYVKIVGMLFISITRVAIIIIGSFLFGIFIRAIDNESFAVTKYFTITAVAILILVYSGVNFSRKINST